MGFFADRKVNAIRKIFPAGTVEQGKIDAREKDWGVPIQTHRKVYIVYDAGLRTITEQQTKELEKKRLRITSIEFEAGKIILQRKLKVFDWFLIYAAMRISIGALLVLPML